MARKFLDLMFTPTVVDAQLRFGHGQGQRLTENKAFRELELEDDPLSGAEAEFIQARDSFYMATDNEDG